MAILTKMGHSVVTSENGLDALDKLRVSLSSLPGPITSALVTPSDITLSNPTSISNSLHVEQSTKFVSLNNLVPNLVDNLGSPPAVPRAFDVCLMNIALPV